MEVIFYYKIVSPNIRVDLFVLALVAYVMNTLFILELYRYMTFVPRRKDPILENAVLMSMINKKGEGDGEADEDGEDGDGGDDEDGEDGEAADEPIEAADELVEVDDGLVEVSEWPYPY